MNDDKRSIMYIKKISRRYLLAAVFSFVFSFYGHPARAQSFDEYLKKVQTEFKQYESGKERGFKEYRDKVNTEFAGHMRKDWPEYRSRPADSVPDSPEPSKPVFKDPGTKPAADPIPVGEVLPPVRPVEPVKPSVPLPEPAPSASRSPFSFSFYGRSCPMPLDSRHRFSLSGITEQDVAAGWKTLSADDYLPIVSQCLDYRDKMLLCDWGYFRFVEQLTSDFLGSSQQNEARLMQMYILVQSGYKVRIARMNNRLVLLIPSEETVYDYPYLAIHGQRYYIIDPSAKGETIFNLFERDYPGEKQFSFRIPGIPELPIVPAGERHFQSRFDAGISKDISVNMNLMNFYEDYPTVGWELYCQTSLSDHVKQQLYPVLKAEIAGKNKAEAANMLLHFVQTAFAYMTDQEQFGYERPFFADELFFHPYSDCEDRAILFFTLIRDLLDLDVVFLHYPGHLATAVCFDPDVPGDHLRIDGRNYIVCDPTYINSDIGQSMPQFKQIPATIIRTQ